MIPLTGATHHLVPDRLIAIGLAKRVSAAPIVKRILQLAFGSAALLGTQLVNPAVSGDWGMSVVNFSFELHKPFLPGMVSNSSWLCSFQELEGFTRFENLGRQQHPLAVPPWVRERLPPTLTAGCERPAAPAFR